MYQDPQRWSYTFQTYSCMSRLRTQLQPPPARLLDCEGTPVQVYERSVYSDRWGSQSCQGNSRPMIKSACWYLLYPNSSNQSELSYTLFEMIICTFSMLYIQSPLFCLCSDRYIFALNMFELGCINSTEWTVYQDWHSLLVEQFGHQVELEGIIYLRAPPKVRESDICHIQEMQLFSQKFIKRKMHLQQCFISC